MSDHEHKCHDCSAREGELHELGCDMEKCPFCGGQLITCSCRYTKLGMKHDWNALCSNLPPEIYANGLPEDLSEKFDKILEEKGRIPCMSYPIFCARCGTQRAECKMYPDWLWKRYVSPRMQSRILCDACFQEIKKLIDERSNLRPIEWVECPFCKDQDNGICQGCRESKQIDLHAISECEKSEKEHKEMMLKLKHNLELSSAKLKPSEKKPFEMNSSREWLKKKADQEDSAIISVGGLVTEIGEKKDEDRSST